MSVQAPGWAEKVPLADRASLPATERISQAWAALDGIDELLDRIRPKGGVVTGKVSAEYERYFALKELADSVGETLNAYEDRIEDAKFARLEGRQPETIGRKPRYRHITEPKDYSPNGASALKVIASAERMEEALRELFDSSEPLPDDADLFDVENRLALLRLMASAPADDRPVYLGIRGFPEGKVCRWADALESYYRWAWVDGLAVELGEFPHGHAGLPMSDRLLHVKGVHARPLALTEVGTHLFLPKHGGPIPVRVDVVDGLPPRLTDPFAFGPIVRVYPEEQPVMDVRTGLVSPLPGRSDFAETFRTFTLAALPRTT